jgi:hypothetical protein
LASLFCNSHYQSPFARIYSSIPNIPHAELFTPFILKTILIRRLLTPWHSRMDGTHLDFCLNLRLKYSERIIQNAYEGLHGQVAVGWELRDLSTGPETTDGYKVSAVVGAVGSDEVRTLKRYNQP